MMRQLKYILFIITAIVFNNCYSQKNELKPYIDFLHKQNRSSADYILKLFDKHDIVILCERDHRDISQYELIKEIISDDRFINNVGHVFTEFGVHNQTERANKILSGEYKDYHVFEKELIDLYRDLDYWMIWEKYNYWYLLTMMYEINTDLDISKKLTIHMTDIEFDWNNYFNADSSYQRYRRDSILGNNFISDFENILQNDHEPRKKALVILNYYHSFKDHPLATWKKSAASYIFDRYSDRVSNVLINSTNYTDTITSSEYLVDHGKWDAAFKYLDNPRLGFNMKDSPFGKTLLRFHDSTSVGIPFSDVFTGFVFYKPISEWVFMLGIPGFVDEQFKQEFIRRCKLRNPNVKMENILKYNIQYCNRIRLQNNYEANNLSREQVDIWINDWLK